MVCLQSCRQINCSGLSSLTCTLRCAKYSKLALLKLSSRENCRWALIKHEKRSRMKNCHNLDSERDLQLRKCSLSVMQRILRRSRLPRHSIALWHREWSYTRTCQSSTLHWSLWRIMSQWSAGSGRYTSLLRNAHSSLPSTPVIYSTSTKPYSRT